MKQMWLYALIMLNLSGCTQVDDYMLGKDNTPKPKALKPISSKQSFKQEWTTTVGKKQELSAYLKLKPSVQGNIIYIAEPNGTVEALDKNNGKIVWSRKLQDKIVSGPTLGRDYIALGTKNSKIIVLHQKNGTEAWQASITSAALSKPIIVNDKLIAKTIDGNLYAFKLASGEKLWMQEHGAPGLVLQASSSPVVMNDKFLLVGYSDGKLDAVDLQTGQLLWQRSVVYANGISEVEKLVDIDTDPIVQGNTVLLGSYQGYLGAFSLETGQFIWRKPASIYKNMAVRGDTLYLTDSHDVVWAIAKQTGLVKWKQEGLKARGLTEPVLIGNKLLVGDKTGMLHLLALKNGEFITHTSVQSPVTIAPKVVGNKAYVLTANGNLTSYSVG